MKGPSPLRFDPVVAWGVEAALAAVRVGVFAGEHWRLPEGPIPADRPVLLYGNHASNWDGFFYRELQKKLRPGAVTYSLMLERELARRPLFRRLGGLGVRPGSGPSLLAAARTACALRAERSDFFFSVFPQGRIEPASKRPLGFQGGLGHFVRALAPVTLLPVAIDFGFLNALRPHAFIACGEPLLVDAAADGELPEVRTLEREATALLDDLQAGLARTGENPPFVTRGPVPGARGANPDALGPRT